MSLFGIKEKKEIQSLKAQMRPELVELSDLSMEVEKKKRELDKLNASLAETASKLESAKAEIIETDERALLQSFGMYTPHYRYTTSDEYKEKLDAIRAKQKDMLKNGSAVTGSTTWTVNGSTAQGTKMVKDMQKLLLRAFNAECDDAIEHVRFSNLESCEKKIRSSAEAISKLGKIVSIQITHNYLKLKLDELHLMYEYQVKKQEEKDAIKEERQRQREFAKAQKELEQQRQKLEKEQSHYENAIARLKAQMQTAPEADKPAIAEKLTALQSTLDDVTEQITQVDYRTANQRAGYVYVISNIGAFGEDVYKIGMTRRLDPMDRIDELGDASVPFDFDVHALIFTDDAPGLEAALHNAFASKKVNFINQRREFFHVTLDEIKKVVRENYDKSVEFVDVAPAEQYRQSLLLRQHNSVT